MMSYMYQQIYQHDAAANALVSLRGVCHSALILQEISRVLVH
jgi:hypothetical protein